MAGSPGRRKAGRSQGLYLTDKAKAVVPDAARITAEINRQALSEFSRTERAHLIDRLGEVISALKTRLSAFAACALAAFPL